MDRSNDRPQRYAGVEVTEMRLPPGGKSSAELSRAGGEINRTSVRIGLPPLRVRHGESGSIGACGGESTWWRRDSVTYDSAEEETSPKIRVRTLKLLSFPTDLADGGAYVEGL